MALGWAKNICLMYDIIFSIYPYIIWTDSISNWKCLKHFWTKSRKIIINKISSAEKLFCCEAILLLFSLFRVSISVLCTAHPPMLYFILNGFGSWYLTWIRLLFHVLDVYLMLSRLGQNKSTIRFSYFSLPFRLNEMSIYKVKNALNHGRIRNGSEALKKEMLLNEMFTFFFSSPH